MLSVVLEPRIKIALALLAIACVACSDGVLPPENRPPTVDQLDHIRLVAGDTYTTFLSASDPDGDSLSFNAVPDPGFISFTDVSQSGTQTTATMLVAPQVDRGGTFDFRVKVTDPGGMSGSTDCIVEVVPYRANTKLFLRTAAVLSQQQTPQGAVLVPLSGIGATEKWHAVLDGDIEGNVYGFVLWLNAGTAAGETGFFDVSLEVDHDGSVSTLAETRINVPHESAWVRYSSTVTGAFGGVAGDRISLQVQLGVVSVGEILYGEQGADSHVLIPGAPDVSKVPFSAMQLRPDTATVRRYESFEFDVVGIAPFGDSVSDMETTWATSDPAVITVDSAGRITAVGEGRAEVSASSRGTTGTADVHVIAAPLSSLELAVGGFRDIYTGSTLAMLPTAHDTAGALILYPSLNWSSSDTTVLTVDTSGTVVGVGTGVATITAAADGISDMVELEVHAAPVSDFSRITEWTTYQGNASHTGHVEVVLNPAVFEELWVGTVMSSTYLNPPTAYDGTVFVSSTGPSSNLKNTIAAYDAVTGTRLWTYNFGQVESVHPPATYDGRVYVAANGHGLSYLWVFGGTDGNLVFRSQFLNQWYHYFAPVVADSVVHMGGGVDGGLYAFDAFTGDELWYLRLDGYDQWTPAVRDDLVYTYMGGDSARVTATDAETGDVEFVIPDSTWVTNYRYTMDVAPLLGSLDNLLVTNGDRLISFDLPTRAIGWEQSVQEVGVPTLAGGVLYMTVNGDIEVRTENDGTLERVLELGAADATGPIVATDNLLFVSATGDRSGNFSGTYAIDLSLGLPVWSYPARGHLALSREGILFIASADGTMSAIRVK